MHAFTNRGELWDCYVVILLLFFYFLSFSFPFSIAEHTEAFSQMVRCRDDFWYPSNSWYFPHSFSKLQRRTLKVRLLYQTLRWLRNTDFVCWWNQPCEFRPSSIRKSQGFTSETLLFFFFFLSSFFGGFILGHGCIFAILRRHQKEKKTSSSICLHNRYKKKYLKHTVDYLVHRPAPQPYSRGGKNGIEQRHTFRDGDGWTGKFAITVRLR